jgi:LmbE family N-acetylglucosaminyl deacetylase
VFTSGNRGIGGNYSLSLERGLEEAYALMAGVVDESTRQEKSIWIGKYWVESWSLNGMPNMQIVYLRLPDSTPSGAGYDVNHGESLKKLYTKEIRSISTTDGNATYTLDLLKDLIATILHERKPNIVRILNHKAPIPDEHSAIQDHADHVVSAKLVKEVVTKQNIEGTVQA